MPVDSRIRNADVRRVYGLWLIPGIWRTIGFHNKQTDGRIASASLSELAEIDPL